MDNASEINMVRTGIWAGYNKKVILQAANKRMNSISHDDRQFYRFDGDVLMYISIYGSAGPSSLTHSQLNLLKSL